MSEETTPQHPSSKTSSKGGVDSFIAMLEPYFTEKAPFQLPVSARVWIADYAWIVTLVIGLLFLPVVFGILAIGGIVGTFAAAAGAITPLYWLALAALVVQIGFLFWAVPGLKTKSYAHGWKIVFYSEIFNAAYSVLQFNLGSIIGGAISLVIGLYFLFQVKSYFR